MRIAKRFHPRLLRFLVLAAMVWLLGGTAIFHVHAERESRPSTVGAHDSSNQPVIVSSTAEDECPICRWKARTPYVPVHFEPITGLDTYGVERCSFPSRAPPATPFGLERNRAPPTLLS